MTKEEMVGWYHRLNGYEFELTPSDGEGQEGLAWCSPGVKKSWTWLWLNDDEGLELRNPGKEVWRLKDAIAKEDTLLWFFFKYKIIKWEDAHLLAHCSADDRLSMMQGWNNE